MNRFQKALFQENDQRPPVWFMRQAGRYHSHYQELKKTYSFLELCKKPDLASEVTRGPIADFDFDAAILFSDLLFPLEAMGMPLSYAPGPQLAWHLKSYSQLDQLKGGKSLVNDLSFQGEAIRKIREWLSPEKGLIGFVGGPLTLFFYAAEGSHQGSLDCAREGLGDGRFLGFVEKLMDLLAENMALQANAGADAIAIFDTCAGEIDSKTYALTAVPALEAVLERFKRICPETPVIYYSKKTDASYWNHLKRLPIHCMGIDWNSDLATVLTHHSEDWAIQGNVDPHWLLLPEEELTHKLVTLFNQIKALPKERLKGWICGLGHGVLQTTPEANVRKFLKVQKEIFGP